MGLTSSERDALIRRYAEGPERLKAALATVPAEALKWRPEPKEWSAHEIICHCADSETNAYARIRYVVAEQEPTIQGYDQDGWALAFEYHSNPLEPALAVVEAVRANTVPLIRRLPEAAWSRRGRHTESGPYGAEHWLKIYADHLEGHAAQIESNVKQWTASRALSALVLWLAAVAPAEATAIIERLPPTEPLLKNPYFDILIVSIREIGPAHATHRDPPRGRLTVEEVPRGRVAPGAQAALWEAPMRGDDYVRAPDGKIRMKPEWYDRPLPPPAAGERLIVFGNVVKSHPYRVLGWAVYRASAEYIDVARRHMAPAERAGWLQLPLFLVVVAAPVAGIVVAVRGHRRRWIYALALVAGAAYAVYESGVSSYTNIRVDLVIIFPALAAMVLVISVTVIVDLIRGRAGRGPTRTAARTRSS